MLRTTALACAVTAVSAANLRADGFIAQPQGVVDVQQTGIYKDYPIAELMNAGYRECYSALYRFLFLSVHSIIFTFNIHCNSHAVVAL